MRVERRIDTRCTDPQTGGRVAVFRLRDDLQRTKEDQMRSNRVLPFMIGSFVLLFAASASADPGRAPNAGTLLPMRAFGSFTTDAETARGLWAEIGTVYSSEEDFGGDLHQFDTN